MNEAAQRIALEFPHTVEAVESLLTAYDGNEGLLRAALLADACGIGFPSPDTIKRMNNGQRDEIDITKHPFFRPFEPTWNYYRCLDCGRTVTTIATARGDYPTQLKCTALPGSPSTSAKPKCDGVLMMNKEYKKKDWPLRARHAPDAEWYKPTNDEMRRMKRQAPKLWEYVRKGGLILRSVVGDYPWTEPGPVASHTPIEPPPVKPGTPTCPDCGNVLVAGVCAIHGDPTIPLDELDDDEEAILADLNEHLGKDTKP